MLPGLHCVQRLGDDVGSDDAPPPIQAINATFTCLDQSLIAFAINLDV
jgi:hypothetical protein